MSVFRKFKSHSKAKYANPQVNPKADYFENNNWIISDFIAERLLPISTTRPFPLNELMLMTGAVTRFRPTHIFDWGTHVGKSARIFYEICDAFDIPCEMHSVDLPDDVEHNEHPHDERGRMVRNLDNVHLHQGDGVTKSLEILAKAKTKHMALFFLDGDHEYETVKRELAAIYKSAPKSLILLHDTFLQSDDSKYNVGPYKAVTEFLAAHPKEFQRVDTGTGLPGMTLLFPATV